MKNLKPILFAFLLLSTSPLAAREYRVALGEVAATLRTAQPGDRIVVTDGTYSNMELKWRGNGTEKKPITIEAATPGAVVVEGRSSLRFAGEWLEIRGLNFRNGDALSGSVVEFRCGQDVANDCRMTECAIDNYNPARRNTAYSYVILYGKRNRIDHCSLTGKLSLGVTLIVQLNEERGLQNFHRIDHNHFGPRPVYGSNGAETIRIGTSQQAYSSSNTIVEDNLFDRCNGEVEVVSVKSSDNIIRRNYFWESQGVLALRHGDRNLVQDNIFVGNGIRNTGGIRIVNAGHKVTGNKLYGIAGTRFFSALAVMDAVPNSLPNRYCLVENVEITNNLFVDCSNIEFGTGKDMERTLAPERVLFANNTISNKNVDAPFMAIDKVDGFTFRDNMVNLGVKTDIAGFKNVMVKVAGAPSEEVARKGKGVSWLGPITITSDFDRLKTAVAYLVKAGDDLPAIVEKAVAGDVIELVDAGGDYAISRAMVVKVPLTIRGAKGGERPIVRFSSRKGDNMITIADGGDLRIEGISFCGDPADGMALAKAGISTDANMIRPYNLYVNNCEFWNFGEGGFFAIKGTSATFAERVEIRNSVFRNLSGNAISYAAERDDQGRYNAEDVIIENCSFFRLLGLPIDIYRGGSDESTAGPYVAVRNCNFEDCCNKERGSVIRLIGPQVLEVTRCAFSNSGRGGVTVRLDEATWEKVSVADCNFWNSGHVLSMTGTVVKGESYNIEPTYTDAAAFDFSQKAGSRLAEMGIGVKK